MSGSWFGEWFGLMSRAVKIGSGDLKRRGRAVKEVINVA